MKIGEGSFAPQRRAENKIVSDLADQGLLLNGAVTPEILCAFALTRQLSPIVLFAMYKQAGLLEDLDLASIEHDKYPHIYRSQS
ncbi:MAG: hypothetical protein ABII80_02485 [bacterium]